MRLLVTGASGFLGEAVVLSALRAGHEVVAMVRPAAKLAGSPWDDAHVRVVRGDLRQGGAWVDEIADVDAVAHLAAAASGDLGEQFQGTVVGTERLLAAFRAELPRFVHVSSFSVYDFHALANGSTLDEQSPLETRPRRRDAYTTTKLFQEQLVREAYAASPERLVIVRPGAIFGPGKDWDHGAGLTLGPVALVFAPHAQFRLTYVDNCADAVVAAAASQAAGGHTINIVDDSLPTHREYRALCRQAGAQLPLGVPVPWWAVRAVGALVGLVDRRLLHGNAKVPEYLASVRQAARWKPLRYSNRAAKQLLGWTPRVPIPEGVRRTVAP
jgi:2-alkyl-3-oxoalkanoate reductase